MRGAEQRVHDLGVGLGARAEAVREIGEPRAHRLEDLFRLGDELAVRLVAPAHAALLRHGVGPYSAPSKSRRAMSRSASGSNGFTR